MRSAGLPIGTVSRQSGVKVPTIRYYEGIGLLSAPPRTDSNRRLYDIDALRRLRFIRHARELGFGVEEIRQLLDLAGQPTQPCKDADEIARHHLVEIDRRLRQLTALRAELSRMLQECEGGRICECRIMESIADHSQCQSEHA